MKEKTITIIVAAAENNAIGKDNDLIWSLPDDLKRFKKLTSGHSIIMGRKTFDSFPGLLPNRKHIVISKKSEDYFPENVVVVNNIEKALKVYELFLNEPESTWTWGDGDSIDRERIRSILENQFNFEEV